MKISKELLAYAKENKYKWNSAYGVFEKQTQNCKSVMEAEELQQLYQNRQRYAVEQQISMLEQMEFSPEVNKWLTILDIEQRELNKEKGGKL